MFRIAAGDRGVAQGHAPAHAAARTGVAHDSAAAAGSVEGIAEARRVAVGAAARDQAQVNGLPRQVGIAVVLAWIDFPYCAEIPAGRGEIDLGLHVGSGQAGAARRTGLTRGFLIPEAVGDAAARVNFSHQAAHIDVTNHAARGVAVADGDDA